MSPLKAYELRKQSPSDIAQKLEDARKELNTLRVEKVRGGFAARSTKIKSVRKDIARCLTILCQQKRAEAREQFSGKKYKPIDIRYKKTRAMRRQLTKYELSLKTKKQAKKDRLYPQRVYCITA